VQDRGQDFASLSKEALRKLKRKAASLGTKDFKTD
jgi:hypothetical protein